ncbi:MAG: EF-hand domain-containing protein [Henriciella sp.]|nr:EF-hand domain-containing protein [Henriciella sp.]
MRRLSIAALLSLGVASFVATALAQNDPGRPDGPASPRLEAFDTNGDGAISMAEIEAGRDARFAEADTNSDGGISYEEFVAQSEQRRAERQIRRQEQMFARLDANADGLVTPDEMEARGKGRLEKMFEQADTDQDGVLSAEELEAAKERRKHHKGRKDRRL